MDLRGLETSFIHDRDGRHVWLILVVKFFFYDVIEVKEGLKTQIIFYRISRVRKEILNLFLKIFNPWLIPMKKVWWHYFTRLEPEVGDSNPRKPWKIVRTQ